MSDTNKSGLGVFLNKKPKDAAGAGALAGPKDVKKRWLYVALGFGGLVMVASTMMSDDKKAPPPVKKESGTIDVTPKNMADKTLRALTVSDIAQNREQITQMSQEMQRMQEEMRALREKASQAPQTSTPAGVVPPPVMPGSAASGTTGGMPPSNTLPQMVPPPMPPAIPAPSKSSGVPPAGAGSLDAPSVNEPMVFKPEKKADGGGSLGSSLTNAAAQLGDSVKAKVNYKKNANAGQMPAGSFAPAVLLNGLDAGTSNMTRTNPQPVLLNIQDHATLPGAAKYQLRSCFILTSGYGDLSAERVYLRLARLSCVDKQNRLVLSTPVEGYVVDSDNNLGLRGTVNNRQGALLGKAMLAGFAQGLSNAMGSAQSSVTSSAFGTTSTMMGDQALRSAGLQGAQNAAGQLAQFYLREAESIFPVITVNGGRTATIVFTQDLQLTWGNTDSQYVKDVQPDNSGGGR